MRLSRERLSDEAIATGFRAEILEKVIYLLELLKSIQAHPYLRGRLALKGGTALNLFVFDVPRLSVDIDLNYVGSHELAVMQQERPKVDAALQAVFQRDGFGVVRAPDEHAGGKWRLRYDSAQGQNGKLEVDLNYMYRVPLWPVATQHSRKVGSYQAKGIPLLDVHELAAGKLTALFARTSGRDLFDTHQLLSEGNLNHRRLRLAFVVYGAMSRLDWREMSLSRIEFDPAELAEQLLPVLRPAALPEGQSPAEWGTRMQEETVHALEFLFPFTAAEMEFLDGLLDEGEIVPGLLTDDDRLADTIEHHPSLLWKALNVRKHKSP